MTRDSAYQSCTKRYVPLGRWGMRVLNVPQLSDQPCTHSTGWPCSGPQALPLISPHETGTDSSETEHKTHWFSNQWVIKCWKLFYSLHPLTFLFWKKVYEQYWLKKFDYFFKKSNCLHKLLAFSCSSTACSCSTCWLISHPKESSFHIPAAVSAVNLCREDSDVWKCSLELRDKTTQSKNLQLVWKLRSSYLSCRVCVSLDTSQHEQYVCTCVNRVIL